MKDELNNIECCKIFFDNYHYLYIMFKDIHHI